ncbi:MAG: IS200/IS605 family transposase [Planctomycetes bacterium]|nr:IS200/IS605 family transposase [Planctomycetota bacterium]
MSHSFVHCLLHVVFSTHLRKPLIDPAWDKRVHAMLGGIAQQRGFRVLEAGGVADHVHLLMVLPGTKPVSDCLRLVKANSSKWINDTFFPDRDFAWQEGYGAFSIAQSQVEATIAYIRGQAEHHRVRTFQDEFRDFLTRQGLTWDERYVWG